MSFQRSDINNNHLEDPWANAMVAFSNQQAAAGSGSAAAAETRKATWRLKESASTANPGLSPFTAAAAGAELVQENDDNDDDNNDANDNDGQFVDPRDPLRSRYCFWRIVRCILWTGFVIDGLVGSIGIANGVWIIRSQHNDHDSVDAAAAAAVSNRNEVVEMKVDATSDQRSMELVVAIAILILSSMWLLRCLLSLASVRILALVTRPRVLTARQRRHRRRRLARLLHNPVPPDPMQEWNEYDPAGNNNEHDESSNNDPDAVKCGCGTWLRCHARTALWLWWAATQYIGLVWMFLYALSALIVLLMPHHRKHLVQESSSFITCLERDALFGLWQEITTRAQNRLLHAAGWILLVLFIVETARWWLSRYWHGYYADYWLQARHSRPVDGQGEEFSLTSGLAGYPTGTGSNPVYAWMHRHEPAWFQTSNNVDHDDDDAPTTPLPLRMGIPTWVTSSHRGYRMRTGASVVAAGDVSSPSSYISTTNDNRNNNNNPYDRSHLSPRAGMTRYWGGGSRNNNNSQSWWYRWRFARGGRRNNNNNITDNEDDFASVQEEWASRTEEDPYWWSRDDQDDWSESQAASNRHSHNNPNINSHRSPLKEPLLSSTARRGQAPKVQERSNPPIVAQVFANVEPPWAVDEEDNVAAPAPATAVAVPDSSNSSIHSLRSAQSSL